MVFLKSFLGTNGKLLEKYAVFEVDNISKWKDS